MILGDLLQQMYNVADTLIVGQFVGADALAAVGSAYTLMTFLTSILLGLSMGAGVAVSISFGRHDADRMRSEVFLSFVMIAAVAAVINIGVFAGIDPILSLLQVPPEVWDLMREYLWAIFFWHWRYLFVQLLCLDAAGSGGTRCGRCSFWALRRCSTSCWTWPLCWG